MPFTNSLIQLSYADSGYNEIIYTLLHERNSTWMASQIVDQNICMN